MRLLDLRLTSYRQFLAERLTFSGGITALVGPNDAGKTTLLRLIERTCSPATFSFSREDQAFSSQEPPTTLVTYRLTGDEPSRVREALRLRRSLDARLDLEFASDGVRACTDLQPVFSGNPLPSDYLERLQPLMPSPVYLATDDVTPMFEYVELRDHSFETLPVLVHDLLAIGSISASDYPHLVEGAHEVLPKLGKCSNDVSEFLRSSWCQNEGLEVQFTVDSGRLVCRVADRKGPQARAGLRPLSVRGAGLRWFMSFLVRLHKHLEGDLNTIFLFDEPAASLHPMAQKDVRRLLARISRTSQVCFSTHSPFLLDWSFPMQVRNLVPAYPLMGEPSAQIRNKPFVESDQLGMWAPFRSNLGVYLGDLGLLDENNILVSGPSDQAYVGSMARAQSETGSSQIDPAAGNWSIIAVGGDGSPAVDALVHLAMSHDRRVCLLTDSDSSGRQLSRRIREKFPNVCVVTVADILPNAHTKSDFEVEDLFDASWFVDLVNEVVTRPSGVSPVSLEELDLDRMGMGAAIEDALGTRGIHGGLPKTRVAAHIGELIEHGADPPPGAWRRLFTLLHQGHGCATYLGAHEDRFSVACLAQLSGPVQTITVRLDDSNGDEVIGQASGFGTGPWELRVLDQGRAPLRRPSSLRERRNLMLHVSGPSRVELTTRGLTSGTCIVEIETTTAQHRFEVDVPIRPETSKGLDGAATRFLHAHPLGSIVRGTILRTGPYGFTVDLGDGVEAFNHISEITGSYVSWIGNYVSVGDNVYVKVIPAHRGSGRVFDVSFLQARWRDA